MEYLLLILSWLLRTYGAIQEGRPPINTPMIWQSDMTKTLLMILWIILLLIGLYLVFIHSGAILLLISLLCYFVIFPALFGKIIQNFIEKSGF